MLLLSISSRPLVNFVTAFRPPIKLVGAFQHWVNLVTAFSSPVNLVTTFQNQWTFYSLLTPVNLVISHPIPCKPCASHPASVNLMRAGQPRWLFSHLHHPYSTSDDISHVPIPGKPCDIFLNPGKLRYSLPTLDEPSESLPAIGEPSVSFPTLGEPVDRFPTLGEPEIVTRPQMTFFTPTSSPVNFQTAFWTLVNLIKAFLSPVNLMTALQPR